MLERLLPQVLDDARRVVALRERALQLAEDAAVDPLTGLANRRAMGRALGRAARGDVVVMLDLDHFKALNDGQGHEAGDEVLRAFGQLLRRGTRALDLCARWGGEEFLVLLPRTSVPDAGQLLARLRSRWREVRPHPVTFSAGLAAVHGPARDALAGADRALYRAKEAGRDRWMAEEES